MIADQSRADPASAKDRENGAQPSRAQGPEWTTRCGFCAHEFTEEEGAKACGKCAHFGGCRMVMCPRCGYEMPETPKLIKMLGRWRLRRSTPESRRD